MPGCCPPIALPVYVLGVELLPKSFFRRFPYHLLTPFAELLRLADLCLSPLIAVGRGLVRPLLPPREKGPRKLFVAREDFKYLTIESERQGAITAFERQMIHQVVDFRGIKVRDVMLPIERVISVPVGASIEEVLFLSHKHDIDRFPVVTRSGDLIGLVNVLELLLDRTGTGNISQYQCRLVAVTPHEPAYNAIRKLRAARTTLASVVEDNQPIGIVSSEELIARLVNTAKR
ncbi:MAG: CBS domain-containing protein [Chthoniobacteraceae bacterium]